MQGRGVSLSRDQWLGCYLKDDWVETDGEGGPGGIHPVGRTGKRDFLKVRKTLGCPRLESSSACLCEGRSGEGGGQQDLGLWSRSPKGIHERLNGFKLAAVCRMGCLGRRRKEDPIGQERSGNGVGGGPVGDVLA